MALSVTSLNRVAAVLAGVASFTLAGEKSQLVACISASVGLLLFFLHTTTSFLNVRTQNYLSMGYSTWWGLFAIVQATAPGFDGLAAAHAAVAALVSVYFCFHWITGTKDDSAEHPPQPASHIGLFCLTIFFATCGTVAMFYFPAYAAWTGLPEAVVKDVVILARIFGSVLFGAAFWHFLLTLGDYAYSSTVLFVDGIFLGFVVALVASHIPQNATGYSTAAVFQVGLVSSLACMQLLCSWLACSGRPSPRKKE